MQPERLSPAQVAEHLASEPPEARAIAMALRESILRLEPNISEAIQFNCLSYFHGDAPYRWIGGNICMIESRDGKAALSFIHGTALPDPHRLLRGGGKAKRFVPIAGLDAVKDERLLALIRAAATRSLTSP